MNMNILKKTDKEKDLISQVEELDKHNQELQKKIENMLVEQELTEAFNQEKLDMLDQMLGEFDALGFEFRRVCDEIKKSKEELNNELEAVKNVKNELMSILNEGVDSLS